jgi:hypothetical protein
MLGIDCLYYKTNVTHKYASLFFRDLLGNDMETNGQRCFLFEYGKLKQVANLPEAL